MAASAAQKLRPSKLSDQLETLNTDIDYASLNLAVDDKASFPLVERIVASNITRTIEGASTLTLTVNDADRVLLRSGYIPKQGIGNIGKGYDVLLDGLWFRLWRFAKNGDDLTLTFIDREVAVLKEWPPTTKPETWWRTMPADTFGLQTRFMFAKRLIDDVAAIVPIRFVCPALTDQTLVGSGNPTPNPSHGFPTQNDVSVKSEKADAQQLRNLDLVLQTGDGLKARRKVLIAAVAVVTQESTARTTATNGDHVGLFQQDAADDWPATRDPVTDAAAFFSKAIALDHQNPNWDIDQLGELVEHSGNAAGYKQWVEQATHTVDVWLGNTDTTTPAGAIVDTTVPDPTKGQFVRGRLESPSAAQRKHKAYIIQQQNGVHKAVVREDNWACLTRLAAEIGFRCFCVSGTVYFISDYDLFHQRVAMTLSEDADGVDNIDCDFTQGKTTAKLTVACRADRWKVPPGGVAAVEEMGPASGRWLTAQTSRSLDDPATTITLQKPVKAIPESAAPEHGAGQTSGTQTYAPPPGGAPGGPADQGAMQRVAIAEQLLKQYRVGWFDDNGQGLKQIQTVASGGKLDGAEGAVDLDTRTMRTVLFLIGQGYTIGTFAWCTDHSDDGIQGHAGGHAVDISSINGVSINSFEARALTLAVAKLLHGQTGALAPRQLICGGYGGVRDAAISALSIPGSDSFYGATTMQQHTNHIHVGF